ncbi:MAG: cobalamin biosynthesis protein [Thermoplasmataceae archaeon]
MTYSYILLPAEGFLLAITIDILFGEPRAFINIRDVSGRISSWFYRKLSKGKGRFSLGFVIVLLTSLIIIIPAIIILNLDYEIYTDTIIVFLYALILTSTFRITSVGAKLKPVINYLENNDIEGAQVALSLIAGSGITESDSVTLNSRIIEVIGKEFMEGIVGPLFYFIFFGLPGAILYRVICSTRDANRRESFKEIQLGKFSSYASSFLNWSASGIASAMLIASVFLLNLNVGRISPMKAARMASERASGVVVASMATALNIKIEHFGEYVMNDSGFPPQLKDIKNSMKVYYLSIFIYLALIVIPMALAMIFFYHYLGFPTILL